MEEKRLLRSKLRNVRRDFFAQAQRSGCMVEIYRSLAKNLVSVIPEKSEEIWTSYIPFDGEIDPSEVRALRPNICWAFPRIDGSILNFRLVDRGFEAGSMAGLQQPSLENKEVAADEIAGYLVPGVAFDRSGRRLGMGKGFYDRALALSPQAVRVGVAYSAQLVDEVPVQEHDLNMNYIATEEELICSYSEKLKGQ